MNPLDINSIFSFSLLCVINCKILALFFEVIKVKTNRRQKLPAGMMSHSDASLLSMRLLQPEKYNESALGFSPRANSHHGGVRS